MAKKCNSNLNTAKKKKNDEFYTRLIDIEDELKHYKDYFSNKIVYCNCDDPYRSNFVKYFITNFETLNLKQLVVTCYKHPGVNENKFEDGSDIPIKFVYNGGDIDDAIVTPLEGDGDFRSDECIAILNEVDVVVTNPPFSLFRDFIDILIENNSNFIVVGSQNDIANVNVFNYLHKGKLWLGVNNIKQFICYVEDESNINKNVKFDKDLGCYMATFGNIGWYTNIEHDKRIDEIELTKTYNPIDYPVYDNYDAISVSRVKDIPKDYDGEMGVPTTFIKNYNPNQFEIIGNSYQLARPTVVNGKIKKVRRFYVNEKCLYDRIVIKNRKLK